ncbi:MAG TPA: PqqD family protein [Syntrophales bacterium]|nr:PqqD family protein [Syntrophales bacterium]
MIKISRRSLMTGTLSLAAASLFSPIKLAEARAFLQKLGRGAFMSARPIRKETTHFERTPAGIIVNDDQGHKLCLNETAFHVLALCNGENTGYEISRSLMKAYKISGQQAIRDTTFTLSVLRYRGLIKV